MPIEWVIGGMATIISVLAGVVAFLWRIHLAEDARERRRADEANARLGAMVELLKKAAKK